MGKRAAVGAGGLPLLAQPVALAKSAYNPQVMEPYAESFTAAIAPYLAKQELLVGAEVPGALELAHALRLLAARSPKPAVLVALGCVIRGDTYHFEIVAQVSAQAIQRVSEDTGLPVINGVLTCDTLKEAMQRCIPKSHEAAHAAAAMAQLSDGI